jgi:hypothetical protein
MNSIDKSSYYHERFMRGRYEHADSGLRRITTNLKKEKYKLKAQLKNRIIPLYKYKQQVTDPPSPYKYRATGS